MFSSPLPLISVIVSNKILSPPSNIMIIIIITTTFVYVMIHDLTKIRHQKKRKNTRKRKYLHGQIQILNMACLMELFILHVRTVQV